MSLTVQQNAFSKSIVNNIAPDKQLSIEDGVNYVYPFIYVRLDVLLLRDQQYCYNTHEQTTTDCQPSMILGALSVDGYNYSWCFNIKPFEGYLSTGDIVVNGILLNPSNYEAPLVQYSDSIIYNDLYKDPVVKSTWVLFVSPSAALRTYSATIMTQVNIDLNWAPWKYHPYNLPNYKFFTKINDITSGGSTMMGLTFGQDSLVAEIDNNYLVTLTNQIPATNVLFRNYDQMVIKVISGFNHVQVTSKDLNTRLYYNNNTMPFFDIKPESVAGYCCNQNGFSGVVNNNNAPLYCGEYVSSGSGNYSSMCQNYFHNLCGSNVSGQIQDSSLANGMFLTQCKNYCRDGATSLCDVWATNYCAKLGDVAALKPENAPLCACFLSQSYQDNYRNSLVANIPSFYAGLVSYSPYCIYKTCSQIDLTSERVLHPHDYIKGVPCPSLVICDQNIEVNNNGTINSNSITVAATISSCGASSGTGISTSTTTSTTTGTSQNQREMMFIYIVIGIVALFLLIIIIYYSFTRKSKQNYRDK